MVTELGRLAATARISDRSTLLVTSEPPRLASAPSKTRVEARDPSPTRKISSDLRFNPEARLSFAPARRALALAASRVRRTGSAHPESKAARSTSRAFGCSGWSPSNRARAPMRARLLGNAANWRRSMAKFDGRNTPKSPLFFTACLAALVFSAPCSLLRLRLL